MPMMPSLHLAEVVHCYALDFHMPMVLSLMRSNCCVAYIVMLADISTIIDHTLLASTFA